MHHPNLEGHSAMSRLVEGGSGKGEREMESGKRKVLAGGIYKFIMIQR